MLTNQLTTANVSEEQAALALEAMLGQEPERRIAKLELYLQATRDPTLREAALRCFSAYDALAASALSAMGLANPQQIAPIMVAIIDGLQLRRLASGEDHLQIAEPLTTMLGAIKQAQSDPGQPRRRTRIEYRGQARSAPAGIRGRYLNPTVRLRIAALHRCLPHHPGPGA